jgi:hypothetical protein
MGERLIVVARRRVVATSETYLDLIRRTQITISEDLTTLVTARTTMGATRSATPRST